MPQWLDNLYARKKSKYKGVREQYRVCKKAIRIQRVAYNELGTVNYCLSPSTSRADL